MCVCCACVPNSLYVCLSVCLSLCLSVCLSSLSVCLCLHPSSPRSLYPMSSFGGGVGRYTAVSEEHCLRGKWLSQVESVTMYVCACVLLCLCSQFTICLSSVCLSLCLSVCVCTHLAPDTVPDVVIWMLSGKTHVAYKRIPAHHLMYASQQMQRGELCGTIQTIMLEVGAGPGNYGVSRSREVN